MNEVTKEQLQESFIELFLKEEGLVKALELTLNSLMYCERERELKNNSSNKNNGYREMSFLGIGEELNLRIPRDRLGVFKPMFLALLEKQKNLIEDLSLELYGKGLTTRQIVGIMQKVYSKCYSKSSISSIIKTFYNQMEQWRRRQLKDTYLVVYIDVIYLKIKKNSSRPEAFYIMLGVKKDYTREIISIVNIPPKEVFCWKLTLQNLKNRGLKEIGLIVSNKFKGLEESIPLVYKNTLYQECVGHLKQNVLEKVATQHKPQINIDLKEVFDLDIKDDNISMAYERLLNFSNKWKKSYKHIENLALKPNHNVYFTYIKYHYKIRKMICSTNWIARFNKEFRSSFEVRSSIPTAQSALTLLSKVAMDNEISYLKHPIYNFKLDDRLNKLASL